MRALQQTLFLLLDFWLVLKWAFALLSKYPTKYPDSRRAICLLEFLDRSDQLSQAGYFNINDLV
ncbi:hypothetical protein GCM10027566_07500 [Arachidicoccus ginsenosidivorans]